MLPKFLQILQPEDLRCVQILRGGRVRLPFREKAGCDHLLSDGLCFEDQDIPVTKDAERVTVLYIRDLRTKSLLMMSSTSFLPMVKSLQ